MRKKCAIAIVMTPEQVMDYRTRYPSDSEIVVNWCGVTKEFSFEDFLEKLGMMRTIRPNKVEWIGDDGKVIGGWESD